MNKNLSRILLFIGGFLALIILIRLGAWMIRVLVVLATAGLAGWLIYQVVHYFLGSEQRRTGKQTLEGEIEKRLTYCISQREENEAEMQTIQDHILEIIELDAEQGLGEKNTTNRSSLLKGFQRELDLRQAKADFFDSAIEKLERLSHNRKVAKKLEEKKKELEALQENHYEELADLEELKTQTEMDVLHLRTIEELSSQMRSSESRDEAVRLKRELETLTSDLKRL